MAGDWIKVRKDLPTDPSVIMMAGLLGEPEDLVVGQLIKLWSWADSALRNGNARGVTLLWIDRYIGVENFAKAMVSAGWLEEKNGGVLFPKWERHMGQSAKRRALTKDRVVTHRKRRCNGGSVTKALPEKRREDDVKEEEVVDVVIPRELDGLSLYSSDRHLCSRWPELYPVWVSAYPGVDVLYETKAAHAWELADPSRRKVNRPKFLTNWFKRAQDRPRHAGNGDTQPQGEHDW